MKTKPVLFRVLISAMILISLVSAIFIIVDFYKFCLAEPVHVEKCFLFLLKLISVLGYLLFMLYLLFSEQMPSWLAKLIPNYLIYKDDSDNLD